MNGTREELHFLQHWNSVDTTKMTRREIARAFYEIGQTHTHAPDNAKLIEVLTKFVSCKDGWETETERQELYQQLVIELEKLKNQ